MSKHQTTVCCLLTPAAQATKQCEAPHTFDVAVRYEAYQVGHEGRDSIQLDPGRCMVTWLLPSANLDIHSGPAEPVGSGRADEQMVHTKAGTPIVTAAIGEIPISVDALLGMKAPYGIDPAILEHFGI